MKGMTSFGRPVLKRLWLAGVKYGQPRPILLRFREHRVVSSNLSSGQPVLLFVPPLYEIGTPAFVSYVVFSSSVDQLQLLVSGSEYRGIKVFLQPSGSVLGHFTGGLVNAQIFHYNQTSLVFPYHTDLIKLYMISCVPIFRILHDESSLIEKYSVKTFQKIYLL